MAEELPDPKKVMASRLRVIVYWARRGPVTRERFEPFMHEAFDEAVQRGLIVQAYVTPDTIEGMQEKE